MNTWAHVAVRKSDGRVHYFLTKEEIPYNYDYSELRNIAGVMKGLCTNDVRAAIRMMNR